MFKIKFDNNINRWVVLCDGMVVNTYYTKRSAILDSRNLFLEIANIEIEERDIDVEILYDYNQEN